MRTNILMLLSFALLSFTTFDQDKIKIQIIKPVEKWVHQPMDTIWIEADVRSSEQLHNISIEVLNLNDSVVLYNKNIHTHSNAAHVKEFFINPLLEKKGLRLTIKTNDHSGKVTASEWLNFSTAARKKKSSK
jgi:hypothetical protein